jgi:hypothetical protein
MDYYNLGRQDILLMNKYPEEGEYSTEWDGSGYPEGIYIYRV